MEFSNDRPAGSEVTVSLLADGADTGRELRLNEGNGWRGSFDGLPRYDHGREVAYAVTEAEVSGVDGSKYETSVEGNASDGFTITNVNTETVEVSEFFMEKVPPKPQQTSASGRSMRSWPPPRTSPSRATFPSHPKAHR